MLTFNQLLALLAREPVALWGDWLQSFMTARRFPGQGVAGSDAKVSPAAQRAVASRAGAVTVIPVSGVITGKPTMWEPYGLTTSVQTVVTQTREAVNNPDVKAVVWDMDTPGGSTSGLAEGHAELMALRGKTPIIAQVNHLSASAGYWIASAADEIVAAPSALTGSVGVYMMHADISKMLEAEGVDVQFIQAGKDKVLGNQFGPLGDAGREYFQGLVDHAYQQFTDAVATGRGVSAAEVRSERFGEGRVLTADAAKKAGMVDAIRTMDQTLTLYGASAPTGDRQRRTLALKLQELNQ